MRYAGSVRGAQGSGDLPAKADQHVDRAGFVQGVQRVTLYELHHNKAAGFRFTDLVNGDDVRMIECRDRFGFLLEAAHAVGILGEFGGQELDGNLAFELRVLGKPDFAHAPGAERRDDSVMRDRRVG